MCGIIFATAQDGVEINDMLEHMEYQRHRGDGYGLGVQVISKGKSAQVYKTLEELDDVETLMLRGNVKTYFEALAAQLKRDKTEKRKPEEIDAAVDIRKKMFQRFSKIFDKKADAILLHTRFPTVGGADPTLIHPIVHGKKRIMHNGSVYGATTLSRYKRVMEGENYDPDIDTAVLLHVFEEIIGYKSLGELNEKQMKAAYNKFRAIFNCFGVVFICEDNHVLMMKDEARSLYTFMDALGEKSLIMASEPIHARTYESVFMLESGYLLLNIEKGVPIAIDMHSKDVTKDYAEFVGDYSYQHLREMKCDCCSTEKVGTIAIRGAYTLRYCADCFVNKRKTFWLDTGNLRYDPDEPGKVHPNITQSRFATKSVEECNAERAKVEAEIQASIAAVELLFEEAAGTLITGVETGIKTNWAKMTELLGIKKEKRFWGNTY